MKVKILLLFRENYVFFSLSLQLDIISRCADSRIVALGKLSELRDFDFPGQSKSERSQTKESKGRNKVQTERASERTNFRSSACIPAVILAITRVSHVGGIKS